MNHIEERPIRTDLFTLVKKLELHQGKNVPFSEIARETGLNRNTLDGIAQNRYKGIQFNTLQSLLLFFRRRGLDVGICDLIIEETPTPTSD